MVNTVFVLAAALVCACLVALWLFVRAQNLAARCKLAEQQNTQMREDREQLTHFLDARLSTHVQQFSAQMLEQHRLTSTTERDQYVAQLRETTQAVHERLDKTLQNVSELAGVAHKGLEASTILHKAIYEPRTAGWAAETALENCLRSFNLRKGIDYDLQASIAGDDGRLRPDAIIYLPENTCLIIDSKSSRFLYETNDIARDSDVALAEREKLIAEKLMRSVRTHVRNLAKKDYPEGMQRGGSRRGDAMPKQITLMWLPSETALDNVLAADPEILEYAKQHSILLCGPSGLWSIVALAEQRIAAARHSENQEKIKLEIEKMLQYITKFNDHAQTVRKRLQSMSEALDKFEGSFHNRLMSSAHRLVALGVQPPAGWRGRDGSVADALDSPHSDAPDDAADDAADNVALLAGAPPRDRD